MITTPHPTRDTARPRSRRLAVAAAVLVWLAGAPGPLAVFASSLTFGSSASTDTARLGFALLSGGLLVTQLGTAVAGVVVVVWLWRAWANAAAWGPQRWSQAWVVAAWFVPVVNLWVPAVIVTDIARASLRPGDPAAGRIRAAVAFWWAGWLGAWVALSVAMAGFPLVSSPDLGALYRWFALFTGLSALLSIVAAAAFTSFALRIAERQDTTPPGPGFPGPRPPGAAGNGPTAPVWAPAPPGTPAPVAARRPRWLVPAVLGAAVVLVVGAGVALVVTGDDPPAEVVAAAVEDARDWSGANYRGTAQDPGGSPVEFDITVTATGARGTLTRTDGRGRAEVVQDGTGVLINGDREWWAPTYPERADQLADRWLSDAGTETLVVDHILRLTPAGLEGEVHPELGSLWERTGERVVDGQPAIVLDSGLLVLVVTAEEPYRLLSIEYTTGGQETEPVRVTVVDPAQAAEVDEAAARIRRSESPRTLARQLLLRPQADIQVRPEPLCTTATCTASFTATNTGEIRITGRFEMTANGSPAGSGRVDLRSGKSATFDASTPNPFWDTPGARGDIYWQGRIIPD